MKKRQGTYAVLIVTMRRECILAHAVPTVDGEGCGAGVVSFGAGLGWRAVEGRGALGGSFGCAVMGCVGRVAGVGDGCGHSA
jgi:hypothetical protein